MTRDVQLQQHPLYLKLTDGQRRFVDVFVETRDKVQAAHAAYQMASDLNARNAANTMLKHPRISQVIALALGDGEGLTMSRSELLGIIADRIRSASNISDRDFGALVSMYAQLKGWDVSNEFSPSAMGNFARRFKEVGIVSRKAETPKKTPKKGDVFDLVKQLEAADAQG